MYRLALRQPPACTINDPHSSKNRVRLKPEIKDHPHQEARLPASAAPTVRKKAINMMIAAINLPCNLPAIYPPSPGLQNKAHARETLVIQPPLSSAVGHDMRLSLKPSPLRMLVARPSAS